jgi:hypothetical protein
MPARAKSKGTGEIKFRNERKFRLPQLRSTQYKSEAIFRGMIDEDLETAKVH